MSSSTTTAPAALLPPAGVESNFVNPPTLMPAVIVTAALVYFVATLFVLARFFVKVHIVRAHHVEDYLSYFAWTGLITYTSLLIYVENYGLARHMWDIPLAELPYMLYYVNILYCIYSPTTAAAKLSALFQIKRIFAASHRNRVWWVIVVSIVLNVVFYLGLFLSYVFQCWPRKKIWEPTLPEGKCVNSNSSNLAAGILNLVSDLEALLLPGWAIWHLQLPVKRKLSIYAVFGVGSLACGIGIGGIYVRVLVLRNADFTWLGTQLAILVISEIAVVVMVGCFPVLPRLYMFLCGAEAAQDHQKRSEGRLIHTIGGSGPSANGNGGKGTSMSHPLAKYLGPGRVSGMTTLGSHMSTRRGSGWEEEEEAALRSNIALDEMRKTIDVERQAAYQVACQIPKTAPPTAVNSASLPRIQGQSGITVAMASRATTTNIFHNLSKLREDARYWWETTGRDIANMLQAAAYPEATQVAFLSYYRDAVCPLLGGQPQPGDPSQAKSWTWDGSTHEYSFEIKKGQTSTPDVRLVLDASPLRPINEKNPLDTKPTEAVIETFARRAPGFDRTWYDALKRSFDCSHLPASEQKRLAALAGHLTPILIGYDITRHPLSPSSTNLPILGKAYFLPCFAAAAGNTTRFAVICESIRNLPGINDRPNILAALSSIEDYLATKPLDWANGARFLGTDFLSPDKTRLKIYLRCPGTSFDEIWDYFTLGGRIGSLEGDKKQYRDFVNILSGVTPRVQDTVHSAGQSNSTRDGGIETGARRKLTTMYFSLDNRYPVPSPKVAFCARNFAASDAAVAHGLESWLAKHGWAEPQRSSPFGSQVAQAFTHRTLSEKSGIFTFIGLARKNPMKRDLSIQTYLCPELYESSRTVGLVGKENDDDFASAYTAFERPAYIENV